MRYAAAIAIVVVLTACAAISEVDRSPSAAVALPAGPSASVGRDGPPTGEPSPSLPAAQPITESVHEDGIRLTVTLDHDRSTFGQRVMATATLENTGTDTVFWSHPGACPYPAWIQVRPDDPVPMPYGRDDWPGELGVLKWVTVDEDLVAADPMYSFLPEEWIDFGRLDCQDVSIVEELPAGESLVQLSGWDTLGHYGMPPPPGSYTVDASFDFMSRGTPPAGEVATDEFSVDLNLPLEIGGADVDYVSPGEAVDALLADHAFQARLADAPQSRWLQSDIEFLDGEWETALYITASATEVEPVLAIVAKIDARTGVVLEVGLETRSP